MRSGSVTPRARRHALLPAAFAATIPSAIAVRSA